jgi:membrane fusion protein (multidrug efflux system)
MSALVALLLLQAPLVETVRVVAKPVERVVRLPAELLPHQKVAVRAKVMGFVETVEVDRGSVVTRDQVLARLVAPEMKAHILEAESKAQAVEAQRAEAQAKLTAEEGTLGRLWQAAATPGVVAGNDILLAEKAVEAARARVQSLENSARAAREALEALRELERYLVVTAPFDGVITERHVHPGALVGPSTEALFELEQVARLRLVVPVPEADLGTVTKGTRVTFTVSSYPGETFAGCVARVARSLDPKTRTMPVEVDIVNTGDRLAPGMYPEVNWPVRRARPSLLVPPSAVVTTTERTFVIRVKDGQAEWVNVARGAAAGGLVEVVGSIRAGDLLVRRASDEIRDGTRVNAKAE